MTTNDPAHDETPSAQELDGFRPCVSCGNRSKPRLKFNGGNPVWLCAARVPIPDEDACWCDPDSDGLTECCYILRYATDAELRSAQSA